MKKLLAALALSLCALVASATNMSDLTLTQSFTFAGLGSPANGTIRYCSDCGQVNPCAGSGTGAVARRINSTWQCGVTTGSVNGLLKANGAGVISQAAAGTDYATATNGSNLDILRSNGAGGFGTALTPGTGVATALGVNIGSAGAPVLFNGAGGTPSSITLTNGTGYPLAQLTGAASGCLTWLGTSSSANLATCLTDETGTAGGFVRATGATLSPSYISGRCMADQQAGATADVQINACNTALIALGGGIIDATGYGPTAPTLAASISIGDSSGHPVTFIKDRSTAFNITATGGVDAVKVFLRSAITGLDGGNPLTGDFTVAASANLSSVIASYPRTSQWVGNIKNIVVQGNTSATVSVSCIDISGSTVHSYLENVSCYNQNGPGLRITANSGATTDSLVCMNCGFNGSVSTTGCPVLIDGTASSNVMRGIVFIGGTLTHPGASCSSNAIVNIQGGASNLVQGVQFYGVGLESSNAADIGILVNNATNIGIHDVSASANVNNGTSIVKITATLGVSYNIVIDNLAQLNAWTNTIQDVVNSVTYTNAAFPRIASYVVKPPQDSSWSAVQGGVVMRLPRTCKLIADHATQSSATLSNITWSNSCVFQVDASTTYRIDCDVFSSTSNVAGGLFMGLTGPASPVAATYYITEQRTQATPGTYFSANLTHTTTYSTVGVGAVGQTVSTVFPARFAGTFENGTTAGTLSIQIANGSATGALTLKRGSSCTVY